ncbi:hypothetical protein ZWY2020_007332 [Hordeum vulgare]|nr:hypothetical protein ZWY2020_007332 [Hordeum vulgare]
MAAPRCALLRCWPRCLPRGDLVVVVGTAAATAAAARASDSARAPAAGEPACGSRGGRVPLRARVAGRRMEELYLRDSRRRVRWTRQRFLPSPRDRKRRVRLRLRLGPSHAPAPPRPQRRGNAWRRLVVDAAGARTDDPAAARTRSLGRRTTSTGRRTSSSSAAPVGTARPSAVDLFYRRASPPRSTRRTPTGSRASSTYLHLKPRSGDRPPQTAGSSAAQQLYSTNDSFRCHARSRRNPRRQLRHGGPKRRRLGSNRCCSRVRAAGMATAAALCKGRDPELALRAARATDSPRLEAGGDPIRSLRSPMTLEQVMSLLGVRGQLLEQGDEKMRHKGARLALIRHALDTINDKLDSEFGSSNYLMQDVLEHGDIGVQYAVVDQLKTEVANLCCHQYGHYVVQSCFLKTGDCRGELLRRLVRRFKNAIHSSPG